VSRTTIAAGGNAPAERWLQEWRTSRVVTIAQALTRRLRKILTRARPVDLGWMSEQWLREYRASNSD
jgi:hypothetical protein